MSVQIYMTICHVILTVYILTVMMAVYCIAVVDVITYVSVCRLC